MRTISFSLFWGIVNLCHSQKVDLDPFRFNFKYRDLPHVIFDSSSKSFTPIIQLTPFIKEIVSEELVASKLILQGYDRVASNADVQFIYYMSDIDIIEFDIQENIAESKNKDGTITRRYSYYAFLKYRLHAIAYLKNKAGIDLIRQNELILNNNLSPLTWKSKEFNKYDEASKYMKDNIDIIKGKLIRDNINNTVDLANRWANYNAGFPLKKDNFQLWLLDNKNHPEYENMHIRWNALKAVLEEISAESMNENNRAAILDAIKYFDNIKITYKKEEKADKKMRYAAFYNNTQLYLLLDMPDEAKKEADGLILNDYDKKDGEQMKRQAEALAELFRKHDIYTRHFDAKRRPYRR